MSRPHLNLDSPPWTVCVDEAVIMIEPPLDKYILEQKAKIGGIPTIFYLLGESNLNLSQFIARKTLELYPSDLVSYCSNFNVKGSELFGGLVKYGATETTIRQQKKCIMLRSYTAIGLLEFRAKKVGDIYDAEVYYKEELIFKLAPSNP